MLFSMNYYYYYFRTVNISTESSRDRRRVFFGYKFWRAATSVPTKDMYVDTKIHC
jgi:hypothetical protein